MPVRPHVLRVSDLDPPRHGAQLLCPDNQLVSDQQYSELVGMHGTIMLLLVATPLFVGFASEIRLIMGRTDKRVRSSDGVPAPLVRTDSELALHGWDAAHRMSVGRPW